MKLNDLEKDPIITEWFDTLNPRPNTRRNYLTAIQAFTGWVGMSPEELLNEAEGEIRAGKLMRERNIKRHIIGFRKHMQDTGRAPNTIKINITGIKSFYRTFDIELPTLPRAGNKAMSLERHNKIPSKEDIQEVLKIADPLERAIILIGVSSGLAAEEIRNLTVGQFREGYDPETEITTIPLRRGKVGFDFVTFLTPEASRAVWDYLNFRARTTKTEKNSQIEKQRVYSDTDYLLCSRWISNTYLDTRDEEMRKLEPMAFFKTYRKLSMRARKNTPSGHWNLIRSHNMRKYFNSALLNAGADSFFVEFTMGHTLDGTRSAYFRASPDKLKEIYKKYVPYLTIQKPLDVAESEPYKKIKHENDILRAETAAHIVERSELQDLRERVKLMEAATNPIDNQLTALLEDKLDDLVAARVNEILKNIK
ncbi:MAG: tyrosine-type recombinase/integrase [Methanosarcinaceae archaeon]|nr:tyrosine-type recombinase/integrase [Methanosarcinaceae archaeon]